MNEIFVKSTTFPLLFYYYHNKIDHLRLELEPFHQMQNFEGSYGQYTILMLDIASLVYLSLGTIHLQQNDKYL